MSNLQKTGICLSFVLVGHWARGGKIMELQHHKFGYSGSDMNFAVFSDELCRISYIESIPIPIGHTQVELYGIEPGAGTKWIVVKQLDGRKATLKVLLRQHEKFLENSIAGLSLKTQNQIMKRFPSLAVEAKPPLEGKELGNWAGRRVRKSVKEFRKSLLPTGAILAIEKRPTKKQA
jgi:hypothetical protein